ncbi:MAG: hypothetical protein JNM84_23840 [Planctomycetes bacterium]|nr:hypothetical protein [Planctomycetota bacterium]
MRRALAGALLGSVLGLAACPEDPSTPAPEWTQAENASELESPPSPWAEPWRPALVACAPCHERVFLEWSESAHAHAWTDRNARQSSREFTRVECRSCHAPQAVLATGLDVIAVEREAQREDGVHCLSCHGLPSGEAGVAGLRDLPTAPCRPRRVEALATNALCFPCHEPRQGTLAEFARSSAAARDERCATCHFPALEGRPGRSHGDWGGANERFVRTGLRFACRVEGEALVVELENRTPHRFPAESRTRSLVVRVEHESGAVEHRSFRRPNEGESSPDERLEPEERRELRFALPGAEAPRRVELLFKTFPLQPDAAAFVLGRWP